MHANVLIISGVVATNELGVHMLGEPLDAIWLCAAFLHDGLPGMVEAGNAVGSTFGAVEADILANGSGRVAELVGRNARIALWSFPLTIALGHTPGLVNIGITVAAIAIQLPFAHFLLGR